jgi:hypothetical protein
MRKLYKYSLSFPLLDRVPFRIGETTRKKDKKKYNFERGGFRPINLV